MKSRPKPVSAAPPAAPPPARKRILLVDDHPFMRAGLGQLIDRQPDLVVCGEAGNPVEAFQQLARTPPDLVLTDLTMPGRGGLEFIKDLRAAHAEVAILVITMHDEGVYAERVLRAGARGYVMKEEASDKIMTAIRRVLTGEVYLSESVAARMLSKFVDGRPEQGSSPVERLSDRELEVFELIGRGLGTSQIADKLHRSIKTIEAHRANIKRKLQLRTSSELLRTAMQWVQAQETA
jgi:DNA-binding NarL/FixJ family response regulator